MKIEAAGITDTGLKRSNNEDSYCLRGDLRLYAVADGMGGHSSGEVASRLAIETLAEFIGNPENKNVPVQCETCGDVKQAESGIKIDADENLLVSGIRTANRRIYEEAQEDPRLRGMGTTIVTAYIPENEVILAHVGDSRAYLIREKTINQITEDHSLMNNLIKTGKLSIDEAASFPYRNVILRALGMEDYLKIDVTRFTPSAGDILLLCTDGLTGMLKDSEIRKAVTQSDSLKEAAARLVELALENGGEDNITSVLVKFVE